MTDAPGSSSDDRPDPTSPSNDYPPPPPAPSSGPSDAPPPAYGSPPPPPAYGAPAGGTAPGGYSAAPPPPPPNYGPPSSDPAYGSASGYASPYQATGLSGNLALWPQRAVGWLIDFIALQIPAYILYGIGAPKVDPNTGLATGPSFVYYLGILYALGIAIYNRWYRGGTTGQTIGRGVAGVTLVGERTGQPIGIGMAFVRDLAHLVDSVICYVGWLFPLWDAKRQTLADKIVSTVVLSTPKS